MLIWAMLIASSFFAAAQVSQTIDPILLTGLRLLFFALMFLPLLLLKNTSPISIRGLLAHAVLGLLLATYFGSLFEALRYTSAVNTATLYTLAAVTPEPLRLGPPQYVLGCVRYCSENIQGSVKVIPAQARIRSAGS